MIDKKTASLLGVALIGILTLMPASAGDTFTTLKENILFVDAEMAEGIMPPFAIVLDRNGTKVQVQFVVTFQKQIALLHRMINRYVLVGWTDGSNLEPKKIL